MRIRFSVPRVSGRGAGLGNELIPWARAFVAGTILGATVRAPAFGLNPRKYRRHFGSSRLDWLANRAIERMLPRFEFTEEDLYRFGNGDLCAALLEFGKHHQLDQRPTWVVVTQGMWGGYRHVLPARDFVRSKLALSKFAQRNLMALRHKLDPAVPTVGVHVRLGDFKRAQPAESYRGQFNISLPIDWYAAVIRSLQQQLSGQVQFLLVTDGSPEQLAPLLRIGRCTTSALEDADVSDMLALANCDLLVCSVSSYSAWAAFLSDAPYVWFEPNLCSRNGFYSIWGHEPRQLEKNSFTNRAALLNATAHDDSVGRGVPVGMDGKVPSALVERVLEKRMASAWNNDLLLYGTVKCPSQLHDGALR